MKELLTNRQIAFIVFVSTIGYAVISIPKSITEKAGTGGWIIVAIGTFIIIIFGYLFIYLGSTFPGKTIDKYMPILTGKFISYLLLALIILYEIMSFSLITRLTSETIKLTILLNTPVWALAVFLLIVSFYTLTKNLLTIARIAEIFGAIIILFGIAIFMIIFTQGDLTNIKPLFPLSEIDYLGSFTVIGFSLTGFEILGIIPMNHNKKKLSRYVFFIQLLIGLIYILIIESSLSVMGTESIIHYEETLFAAIRRIEITALQFLKRLDGIFIIVWLLGIYCSILNQAYIAFYLITKLVKGKKNTVLFMILLLSIIICLTPPTIQIARIILQYVGYLGVFINIALPLLLFILTIIKKRRGKISTTDNQLNELPKIRNVLYENK